MGVKIEKLEGDLIKKLNTEGLSNEDIGKIVGRHRASIRCFLKRNGLKSSRMSSAEKHSKINWKDVDRLYTSGLSDKKIAEGLKISEKSINDYRRKNSMKSNILFKEVTISKNAEEILIGTLLGDGYITPSKNSGEIKTSKMVFAHCEKQKDYCFHKAKELSTLFLQEPKINFQKRNGKINTAYYAHSMYTTSLYKYREIFYIDNIKIIPSNIEEYFTPQSLAYLYMDDGNLHRNENTISLCNFDLKSLINLQNLLLKWDIETTIRKDFVVYIKSSSIKKFLFLISPYIIPSMRYKIQSL